LFLPCRAPVLNWFDTTSRNLSNFAVEKKTEIKKKKSKKKEKTKNEKKKKKQRNKRQDTPPPPGGCRSGGNRHRLRSFTIWRLISTTQMLLSAAASALAPEAHWCQRPRNNTLLSTESTITTRAFPGPQSHFTRISGRVSLFTNQGVGRGGVCAVNGGHSSPSPRRGQRFHGRCSNSCGTGTECAGSIFGYFDARLNPRSIKTVYWFNVRRTALSSWLGEHHVAPLVARQAVLLLSARKSTLGQSASPCKLANSDRCGFFYFGPFRFHVYRNESGLGLSSFFHPLHSQNAPPPSRFSFRTRCIAMSTPGGWLIPIRTFWRST